MRELRSVDDVLAAVGERLGVSDWHVVSQDRIDTFADATGDHQWIHVDPVRSRSGPFGTTVAHGFLTLSMVATFAPEIFSIPTAQMIVNYGLEKARFPQSVAVHSRIRAAADLTAADPVPGGLRMTVTFTVEIEGMARPALVATIVLLVLFEVA